MEVQIDDYGRIVIPKSVRDRLGLEAGVSLELDVRAKGEGSSSITLTPNGQGAPLQKKGELLVHTGRLTEEDFDVVEQIRNERRSRAQKHAGCE